MNKNKIILCPNCKSKMVSVLYREMDELIKEYIKSKKIFYRGLELKEDRNNPEQIKYHCYSCDRSYSKNLKRFIRDNDCEKYEQQAIKEIENIINEISDQVIKEISEEDKMQLKSNSECFRFCFEVYIRNKFIYNNERIKYRIEPDNLSERIYTKTIDKIFR